VRKDVPELVRSWPPSTGSRTCADHNAFCFRQLAEPLLPGGPAPLNVHLDRWDGERFARITRRDDLEPVLEGLALAKRLGFAPIKITPGGREGPLEPELGSAAHYGPRGTLRDPLHRVHAAGRAGPLGPRPRVDRRSDHRDAVAQIGPLEEIPDRDPARARHTVPLADGGGTIGFIASVSRPFCRNCNPASG